MTLRFARARTTTRGTKHHSSGDALPSFSLLWLLYPRFFFNFDPLVHLRSHVFLLISSMHRIDVFHTDFPNDSRKYKPELSLDWLCKVFSGTQVLPIVIHMSSSTFSICLSVLKLRIAFHFCIVSLLSIVIFSCPLRRVVSGSCSRKMCFMQSSIGATGCAFFSFSQRTQCFLNTANVFLKVWYHRVFFIDPVLGHIAVSICVYRCTFSASENCSSFGPIIHVFFFAHSPICGLCLTECFTRNIEEVTKSLLSYTFSRGAPILQFFEHTTSIVLPSRVIVGSRP